MLTFLIIFIWNITIATVTVEGDFLSSDLMLPKEVLKGMSHIGLDFVSYIMCINIDVP